MTIRTPILALLLLMLAAGGSPADEVEYRKPDKNWGKGPVRWLMSDDEEKDWKKIKTDEERAAFVKAFWGKRDPTPGTPQNEFEELFWKKVEVAEKAYRTGGTSAGSLTDKGKAFILLGPPQKPPDQDARGRELWFYEPDTITGMTQTFTLTFAMGTHTPLLLDKKVLEAYVAQHPETRGIGWKIPVAAPAQVEEGVPTAAAAAAREEDQSPESQRQIPILQAIQSEGKGPTDVPFMASFDFYAAVDGTTLTAVTIEVPRRAARGGTEENFLPFARLVPDAPDGRPVNLTGPLPFIPAPRDNDPAGGFCYQARHNLDPGTYTLIAVVEDRSMPGTMGTMVRKVEVPDYRTGDLDLSSVTLLAGFARLEPPAPGEPERAGPFIIGSFRLVPRGNPALTLSEAFSFYYQVYHPAPDPQTGKPNLEATSTFYLKDGTTWKRFRPPLVRALTGQVDLYSIDMKDLVGKSVVPPASFKMELKIVDKPGGREIKREIPFTVEASAG